MTGWNASITISSSSEDTIMSDARAWSIEYKWRLSSTSSLLKTSIQISKQSFCSIYKLTINLSANIQPLFTLSKPTFHIPHEPSITKVHVGNNAGTDSNCCLRSLNSSATCCKRITNSPGLLTQLCQRFILTCLDVHAITKTGK